MRILFFSHTNFAVLLYCGVGYRYTSFKLTDNQLINFQLSNLIYSEFCEWQHCYGLAGTRFSFGELFMSSGNPGMVLYSSPFRSYSNAFPSRQLKDMLSVARTKGIGEMLKKNFLKYMCEGV